MRVRFQLNEVWLHHRYFPSVSDALAFYENAFGFQTRFLHESGQYGELEPGSTTFAFASYAMGAMNFGSNFVEVLASAIPLGIELRSPIAG